MSSKELVQEYYPNTYIGSVSKGKVIVVCDDFYHDDIFPNPSDTEEGAWASAAKALGILIEGHSPIYDEIISLVTSCQPTGSYYLTSLGILDRPIGDLDLICLEKDLNENYDKIFQLMCDKDMVPNIHTVKYLNDLPNRVFTWGDIKIELFARKQLPHTLEERIEDIIIMKKAIILESIQMENPNYQTITKHSKDLEIISQYQLNKAVASFNFEVKQ